MLKLFISEQGSEKMLRFAESEDDRNKIVSGLTLIEGKSAIHRLRDGGRIIASEASLALDSLTAEMRWLTEQPINPSVIEAAKAVVERHHLRALDAVQLGSAIVARDQFATPGMRLIASDKELLEAAQKERFAIWNPCD